MEPYQRIHAYLAKYRRADHHLAELRNAVDEFMHTHAHRVFTDVYFEDGKDIGYAQATSGVIDFQRSEGWGLIVGDILHSYRATLDHLAYQLACLVRDPPRCKTEFPIYWEPDGFSRFGRKKISCLPKEERDWITQRQPFNYTPHNPKSDPLWLLQDMDIADKHKTLNVTAVVATFSKLTPLPRNLEILDSEEYPRQDALEYGSVLARYQVRRTGPDPDLDVKAEGSFGVVFGKGTAAANQGLFQTVHTISDAVGGILASMVGAFHRA